MLASTSLSELTPETLSTILCPDAMERELDCRGYQMHSNFCHGYATFNLTNCKSQIDPVHFKLKLMHGLLFTEYVITPSESERTSPHLPDGASSSSVPNNTPCSVLYSSVKDVNALTRNQLHVLWHMHLGHIHEQLPLDLHKYVDDVPGLPHSNILHSCPMCAQAKLHKANCGDTNTTKATDCWQDIQIVFGFFVQHLSG